MKKIVVLTATRAEYGLLKNVIVKLKENPLFDVELVVTGMHLSPEFGYTYEEIENDNIEINKKIEILMSSDTEVAMSKSMGLAMISFAEYFSEIKPDGLLVLGDRYEVLAVCCAAMNAGIPIFHISGGELTEGAIDDAIRHSITKMSYLHFTATECYRKRVIQLGEYPDRVFNVGDLGVENVLNTKLLSKTELENNLGIKLNRPYMVVTFHPVTLELTDVEQQIKELVYVLTQRNEFDYIITKANADSHARLINSAFERLTADSNNVFLFSSLGMVRYLSAVKYSVAVLGNSSSGIVEVPSFGIPTINIGNRQHGRMQAKSIINCLPQQDEISMAIDKAISNEFRESIKNVMPPYYSANSAERIVSILENHFINKNIDIRKKFYDINFEIEK